jgi:ribosomal protein S27AE
MLTETAANIMYNDAPDELVPERDACPECGERRMDWLGCDDNIVTCGTCGAVYDLEPERREARDAS